jgi:UDP-2,3-diacylglucosamine pyrophosphatase LpxH
MPTVSVISDLHLEFNQDYQFQPTNADILILSGDICVVEHLYRNPAPPPGYIQKGSYYPNAKRYREFFKQVNEHYQYVFYVLGNHEHYSGLWNETANRLRSELEPYKNITLLDNDYVDTHGYRFIGSTIWTNLNNNDPVTTVAIRDIMNDYRTITVNDKRRYRKLFPLDTYHQHKESLKFIDDAINSHDGPVIVIGHHCPSFQSCHEQYKNEHITNGAYYSNLEEFIASRSNIKLWTCGHTHHAHSYTINDTKVICNPVGYPYEDTGYNPNLVIEI